MRSYLLCSFGLGLFFLFSAQFLWEDGFATGADTPASLYIDPHSFLFSPSAASLRTRSGFLPVNSPPAPKVPGTAPEGLFPPLRTTHTCTRLRQEHPAAHITLLEQMTTPSSCQQQNILASPIGRENKTKDFAKEVIKSDHAVNT